MTCRSSFCDSYPLRKSLKGGTRLKRGRALLLNMNRRSNAWCSWFCRVSTAKLPPCPSKIPKNAKSGMGGEFEVTTLLLSTLFDPIDGAGDMSGISICGGVSGSNGTGGPGELEGLALLLTLDPDMYPTIDGVEQPSSSKLKDEEKARVGTERGTLLSCGAAEVDTEEVRDLPDLELSLL